MPTLFIEEELLQSFRDAVLKKHGKLYGAIREETAVAIEHHTERLRGGKDGGPAARPATGRAAVSAAEFVAVLEQLSKLRDTGILTSAEFAKAKKRLLD